MGNEWFKKKWNPRAVHIKEVVSWKGGKYIVFQSTMIYLKVHVIYVYYIAEWNGVSMDISFFVFSRNSLRFQKQNQSSFFFGQT